MSFRFHPLELQGLLLVEPDVFPDERGWFLEGWREDTFTDQGIAPFVQDNISCSGKHVLRGLHFQRPPAAQGKLVHCLAGSIVDIAVDVRQSSSTFGRWYAENLTSENHRMLYLPPGFAHAFLVLSDNALVHYKVTAPYAPQYDGGVRWNDPSIGIDWPVKSPILSSKDAALPFLPEAEVFP